MHKKTAMEDTKAKPSRPIRASRKKVSAWPAIVLAVVLGISTLGVYAYMSSKPNSPSSNPSPHPPPSNLRNATIVVQGFGTIKIQLRTDKAPVTAGNFISLANRGFYNGLTFHRIIADFAIQGGDPNGDGTGGSGTNIAWENTGLKNVKYSIAMARGSSPDSASSQFYINMGDNTNLDTAPAYVVFGQLTSGQSVADAISRVQTDSNDRPLTPVVMTSVTIS